MAANSDVEAMDTDHVGDLAKGPDSEEGPMEVEEADSNPGSHSDIKDEPRQSKGEEAAPNGLDAKEKEKGEVAVQNPPVPKDYWVEKEKVKDPGDTYGDTNGNDNSRHGCLTRCCKWCNRLCQCFDCFKYRFPIVPCESAVDVQKMDPGDIEKGGGEDKKYSEERQESPSPIRSRVSLISQTLN